MAPRLRSPIDGLGNNTMHMFPKGGSRKSEVSSLSSSGRHGFRSLLSIPCFGRWCHKAGFLFCVLRGGVVAFFTSCAYILRGENMNITELKQFDFQRDVAHILAMGGIICFIHKNVQVFT